MAIHLTQTRYAMKRNTVASIDLILMLPGKTHRPDFESMRMTHFSSADSVLYIESAVPEHMLPSEQAERYVSALVQDEVENAADFFLNRVCRSTEHYCKIFSRQGARRVLNENRQDFVVFPTLLPCADDFCEMTIFA